MQANISIHESWPISEHEHDKVRNGVGITSQIGPLDHVLCPFAVLSYVDVSKVTEVVWSCFISLDLHLSSEARAAFIVISHNLRWLILIPMVPHEYPENGN